MATPDPLADPEKSIRRIYAYVAYRLGHGADAEDVTSQVIERALRYRASFDPSRGEPISWLIGIARTCIDEALKLRAREVANPMEDGTAHDVETATVERLTLAEAVAALEPRERELIALRYGADMTTKAIATELGMEPNAVNVALHRTRVRLRDQLTRSGFTQQRSPQATVPVTRPAP